MIAIHDKAKCDGVGCADKGRCGRFLRPAGVNQAYEAFYKAGDNCQHYESVPAQYHQQEEEPAKTEW